MLNDLLTLARIREGDIKAFEDVFRRYYSVSYTHLTLPTT